MKNYEEYELEDFICDDDFISWCLQPDEISSKFWQEWLQNHPEKKPMILQAQQLITDLNSIEDNEKEASYETEIWEQIEANITKVESIKPPTPKPQPLFPPKPKRQIHHWLLSTAAILIVALGLTLTFVHLQNSNVTTQKNLAALEWINHENNTGLSQTILLADSSKVVLEPFGALKYPTVFEGDERVVFLKGEAFFDIARDTLEPFLVYANETITKVLGTSFRITAFEGEETVEVDVKTGRVAVYAKVAANEQLKDKKRIVVETDEKISIPRPNAKLEVTPNQKVVFNKKRTEMIRTVTEKPQVIARLDELPRLKFENESVVKVFEALEKAYGIDLEYDMEALKGCSITTQLQDEPLFQKLNIICTALELKFSERDAVIYIEGEGC